MAPPATNPSAVPPPDGGWGWAVVLGSFISIGFSYAFPKAITVFFKDIQIIFDASYSQIAWISSIMLAVMYAAGESLLSPLVSRCCYSRWSHPTVNVFSFVVVFAQSKYYKALQFVSANRKRPKVKLLIKL